MPRLRSAVPSIAWDRLLFSAKEAVYKAWFPLTGCLLDFPEADLVFAVPPPGVRQGTFRARLLVPGPVLGGRPVAVFEGRWTAACGLLASVVVVPQPATAISRTSAAFESIPNLLSIRFRWTSTVRGLTLSRSAMSWGAGLLQR